MDMEPLTINGTISDFNSGNTNLINGTYSTNDMNGTMNGDVHAQEVAEPQPTQPKQDGGSPPTYADAFPPLPAGPPSGLPNAQSAWGAGRPTKAKQPNPAANKPILSSESAQVSLIATPQSIGKLNALFQS